MIRKIALLVSFILVLTALAPVTAARADGIIICDPGPCPGPMPSISLTIKYHHVTVTIQDQLVVTHVDQVFYNPNDSQVEGTYIFPIPLDAAVTKFTLWIDGQPVEGKVLDANQARQTYQDIVNRMRDPALLEYAGRGAVQAHIYPIPPHGERRVELEYTQALTAENGLVRYIYPLNTEKFSAQPIESVTVSVDVRASVPIRAVYSPSHEVGVSRDGDYHVSVGYEASNITPNTDFALYYSLGEEQAFHLLTYRDPSDLSDPNGFFLLLLAPRPDASNQVLPKDIILVLDRSGSMEGDKFQQAQEALRYILRHLNSGDRFNIITFSTGIESYASQLRPAEGANEAIAWVDQLNALGSTDINRALLEVAAMADKEKPTYVIFMTDGLPTQGEVDSQKILDNLKAEAPKSLRLFAFGVGYDVDTFLLDSLAHEHHGTSTYVLPSDRLDEVLSGFYARISTPVLTDLALDFDGISAYDLYPNPLPDLFSGSQIIVVGRYRSGGSATVSLSGEVNGRQQTYTFPNQVFIEQSSADDQLAAIPRLWATRKIGYLLSQVRLHGADPETIDQIVKLSIRYGIVTPYTSYLVTEDKALGASAQNQIVQQEVARAASQPTAAASGAGAVQKAADEGQLSSAQAAPPASEEIASQVHIVGARAFVLLDGVWTDTGFDPQTMQTVKIGFLSDDYFSLAASRPELSAAFALGTRVIALSDGTAYEVVADAGAVTTPVAIPATRTPAFTSTPVTPQPTRATPVPSTEVPAMTLTPAPGKVPCASSLIPLAVVLPGLALALKRKKAKDCGEQGRSRGAIWHALYGVRGR
jgi:Ca-activated chloride channel family protein